jgi:hypothetical protein
MTTTDGRPFRVMLTGCRCAASSTSPNRVFASKAVILFMFARIAILAVMDNPSGSDPVY